MWTHDQPRWRTRKGAGTAAQLDKRVTCAVCGFAGISPYATPGLSENHEGSVSITRSGGNYTWDSPDEPVANQTAEHVVQPDWMSACPDCGAERFFDGKRGSAHSVPHF